ncbi:MIT C-terminal domain-containing protein [Paenibacillus elgii]|uniref:MIT C-terminal domain-containing protein n=1 Tax=Paenibacillus elgii TaxID=189691 RepID=UPI0013D518A6|nr:MIT C-terminal domain-containing protein [Paenibacillus elgii]
MLYEFALTPDLFDTSTIDNDRANYFIMRTLLSEISKNGLIANLENDLWIKNVEVRLKALSQQSRMNLLPIMKTLKDRKRIVSYSSELKSEPADDLEWLKVALKLNPKEAFHGIVMGPNIAMGEITPEPCLVGFDKVLDSDLWNCRKTSFDVGQNEVEYCNFLKPILKHAKSLSIIDPYLSTEQRFFDTVKICLLNLSNKNVRVNLHAERREIRGLSEAQSAARTILDWEQKIKALRLPNDFGRVNLFLWKPRWRGQRFHDRAIITDQCGIGIEGGLDVYETTRRLTKTTFNLLDSDVIVRRLRDVDPASGVYTLVKQKELSIR